MAEASRTHMRSGALDRLLESPRLADLGRAALVAPFVISGVAKAFDFAGATAEVRGLTGLEPAWLFAALVVATQLGGSALVLLGGRLAWLGAGGLAAFTIVATLAAHAFWMKSAAERMLHFNIFFEHVAIVGGLVLAAFLSRRATMR
jgi:transmembrane protein